MKYLKEYKIFESSIFKSDIEEAFYNISDRYYVDVIFAEGLEGIFKSYLEIGITADKEDSEMGFSGNLIDYNNIKDDLKFAINYIESELGLDLEKIQIYGFDGLNSFRSFRSLNPLDDLNIKYVDVIKLYFDVKNVQILV